MTFLQWRRFNFFDKDVLKDPATNEAFEKLKEINIACSTYGRGQLVFGDFEGYLHFVSRQLEVSSFKAYGIRVSHAVQMKQHNILVTVGEDEQGINPMIKVWNLDKVDRHNIPACSRCTRAQPSHATASHVTSIAVHENMNYLAVGFDNGCVALYRGDIMRDRHKPKIVYDGGQRITGLAFRALAKFTVLYATTEGATIAVNIYTKDTRDTTTELDAHGCKLGCNVLSDPLLDQQFIIGRPEAIYFYTPEGRGPCLAFEGEKLLLQWFRGYLIIVSKENKPVPRAGTASSGLPMNTVTVYDIHNKLIAYSAPVPEVVAVLCEWSAIYLLAADGRLYHLQEKDTQTKLEVLFRKNMYTLAISLAQSQQYDQDGIIDIFRQYGDHLYSKGDHDAAIQQYIKTIGKLEASYVIRKFLDAQRIHNLTAYLQALHKAQLATVDHTTLLLNCYTKLKDVDKLKEFLTTKDREIDFDVETAIRVCRSAGYYEYALLLAESHQQHDWYIKVQLEDNKDYPRALSYIAKLPFHEAEHNMKQYGKVLVSEAPEKTTQLLKKLCTDYRPSDTPLADTMPQKARAEEFIHIFVNNSEKLSEFLQHMVKVQPDSSPLVYNTLLELYLQQIVHEEEISAKVDKERRTLDLLQNPDALYDLDQALILCQMHNFKAGILYLYEKAKLFQQILRYHMDHNEYAHIIEACKRFGTSDPNLWIQALSYFARKEEDCRQQLRAVLEHVDRSNLLPPLLVVQTLAHKSTATLGVVKDYITRRLQQESDQIAEDERVIAQYREETRAMRAEIAELQGQAKIFQVAKCAVCSHPLELPSVHFLCQHSYHQHCFESYAETDAECPACAPDHRKLTEVIRAQEQGKVFHDQFHHQLERSGDAFTVVADYFGRGMFTKDGELKPGDVPPKLPPRQQVVGLHKPRSVPLPQ